MVVAARRRPKTRPVVVVLMLLAVTLFVIDQAGDDAPTHPVRSIVRDTFASIGGTLHDLSPFGDSDAVSSLKHENQALRSQLETAQGQAAQAADAARERASLTERPAVSDYFQRDALPRVAGAPRKRQ